MAIECYSFPLPTGTFFRHLEKGSKSETMERATLHDPGQACNSITSDLTLSDDDDELSVPDESIADELGS